MRYRLRTLLILLAIGPPLLWGGNYAWRAYTKARDDKSAFKAELSKPIAVSAQFVWRDEYGVTRTVPSSNKPVASPLSPAP